MSFVDLDRHEPDRLALRTDRGDLTYGELAAAAAVVARSVAGAARVAVEAHARAETVIAVLGARLAGAAVIPVNPKSGARERAHVLADSTPDVVLAPGDVDPAARAHPVRRVADPAEPALIIYTSGTTGLPKGVVLTDGALAANVDAVAAAWAWTAADRVAHALPLFHVHGLVLGTLAPLRLGGAGVHTGRFDVEAVAAAVAAGATMVFGVPTMWSRIALAAEADPALAATLGRARLLVSGSAGLPLTVHARLAAVLGRRVVERYGMTETLFSTAERAGTDAPPGSVGPPVGGVELRLVDDEGEPIGPWDDETLGEVQVRGASLFSGYLDAPAATAAAFTADGWFRTGDIAARRPDGAVRIVGRRATDLIKSGGYRIGAGEIESVLGDHPLVAEVAVTGEPDEELGERIVAWVVPAAGVPRDAAALIDHVARELTPHKRPREVRFLEALPRNELGKVLKRALPR
jgi:malonyl-CoA/methylmalonyl-CoA synthetase